jgi:predicted metal-dependent HD superfamily phosphohydrolase
VPEADYRSGRQQILQQFLSRPHIFHHLSQFEDSARHNIATEIAHLARS